MSLPTNTLKILDRHSRVAWCPSARYPTLLASGTIAGTIDDSFESKSQLEIYDIDLASGTDQVRLIGSCTTKDCFNSMAWGPKGIDDGSFPYGLIAGGMSDGSVNVWNAANIVGSRGHEALVSRSEHHKGAVLGLQFHPQQANLLASGAQDGEVYIWDLANPRDPKASKPHTQAKAQASSPITCIAWNKKVPQILASSSETGETTVWDLRQKRSIITFRNSARISVRANALAWNPDASVQLAVCYVNHPIAEIWDLRQAMTPKAKLEGAHQGSILGIDWSPHDNNILITTGEDGRMCGWDPIDGKYLCDYSSYGMMFDVQWSPHLPSVLSACSHDGKVAIQSINHAGPHVPTWLPRPCGATFGFGGKLISWGKEPKSATQAPSPSNQPKPSPKITIEQLVSEPDVLAYAQQFQSVMESRDYLGFCQHKVDTAQDAHERMIWTFMMILLQDPVTQREGLLKQLGFHSPQADLQSATPNATEHVKSPATEISEDAFFEQEFPTEDQAAPTPVEKKEDPKPTIELPVDAAETEDDRAIREALVFGDFKATVSRCIKTGRMADAIIFSSFGGPALWEETRNTYFQQHKQPFIRNVMRSVISQNMEEMVSESHVQDWKQTLAILITYTQAERYKTLVNQLAARLEAADDVHAATLCYMCSSNIDRAVQIWSTPTHAARSKSLQLHHAIEKISVFAHATQMSTAGPTPSRVLSLKYSEYAGLLASQGNLNAAINYLRVAAPNMQQDQQIAVEYDRIWRAQPIEIQQTQQPPVFPFQMENVQLDPSFNQRQQQFAANKAQLQARQPHPHAQQQTQHAPHTQPTPHTTGPATATSGTHYGTGHPPTQQPGGYTGATPTPYGRGPATGPTPNGYPGQTGFPAQATPTPYGGPQGRVAGPGVGPGPGPAGPYGPGSVPGGPGFGSTGSSRTNSPRGTVRPPYPNTAPPVMPPQPQGGYTNPHVGYAPQQGVGYPSQTGAPPPQQPVYQPQPGGVYPPQPTGVPPPQQRFPGQPAPHQYAGAAPPQPGHVAPPNQYVQQTPQHPQHPHPQHPQHPPQQIPPQQPYQPPVQQTPPQQPTIFTPQKPALGGPTPSAAPLAAPAPSAAPIVLTEDAKQKQIIIENCMNQLLNTNLKPAEKKQIQDSKGRLAVLYARMSSNEISATAMSELNDLFSAIQAQDYTNALKHHSNLVKTDWNNNNEWLLGLRTLLTIAKKQPA